MKIRELFETEVDFNPKKYPMTPMLEIPTNYWLSDFEDTGEFGGDKRVFEHWITGEFCNHFNTDAIDCYFDNDDQLIIGYFFSNYDECHSSSHISTIIEQMGKYYEHLMHEKFTSNPDDGTYLVFREALPANFQTEWKLISFYLAFSKPITLSGIDKKIPHCINLYIQNPIGKIKGSVLGLLKIKSLKSLWAMSSNPEWITILMKYIKEGHHDIISCQEELMDKGLGDYAKL